MSGATSLNMTRSADTASDGDPPTFLTIEDLGDGVLRLIGELDMATAPALQRHLERGSPVSVLDLREVTFIDSTGLSVLVRANRERQRGESLILRSPTDLVCRVLEITGLLDVFLIDRGPAGS